MKGLQLSRIGGRWAIGPVQEWWLEFEDLDGRCQVSFASWIAGRIERQSLREELPKLCDERQKLYDKFPACSHSSASTSVTAAGGNGP
jgi:hypothetical protein